MHIGSHLIFRSSIPFAGKQVYRSPLQLNDDYKLHLSDYENHVVYAEWTLVIAHKQPHKLAQVPVLFTSLSFHTSLSAN